MGSDHTTYSFFELLSNIVDNRGKTCPVNDTGFPLIATNCVKNDTLFPVFEKVRYVSQETYNTWFRGHPEPGDIIFVCKGSPGNVCWTPNPVNFCIAQDMLAIRANKEIVDPKFLFALLRTPATQAKILNMHVGTLIPHFKKGDFKNLYFDIPNDMTLQKGIGNIYFTFCEKIELNRQMNSTLESMAQAMFKSWFVDFDPVIDNALAAGNPIPEPLYARAENRKRLGDQRKPLPHEIQELFPDSFVLTEELGWIPEGWEIIATEAISSKIGMGPFGSNIKVSTFVDSGIPIISGCHLNQTLLTDENYRYITEEHALKLHNSIVIKGDLVFTHAGNIGQVSLIPETTKFRKYVISQRQFYLRPDTEKVMSSYLIYFFRSHIGQHRLLSNASQVGVPSIARPSSHLKSIKLVLPDYDILKYFDKECLSIFDKLTSNNKQIDIASSLRDTLLPKLISGQLRLPDSLIDKFSEQADSHDAEQIISEAI